MFWWALFSAGVRLAELLPARMLYGAGAAVARVLASAPSPARDRLRRNFSRVTGQSPSSSAVARLVREAYSLQVANYVDLMRTRRISRAEVEARYTTTGPGWAAMVSAVQEGRGCVLVTPHFGRIELLNHVLATFDLPTALPVERLRPERLFQLVCALRAFRGATPIPHDAGVRPWLRAIGQGHLVALFAERDPSGGGVPVQFFGREARFPPGPAFLALRTGAPLLVGYDLPGDRPNTAYAEIDAPLKLARNGDMEADVRAATQQIAAHFERHIRAHPGRWVMFHDMWPGDVSESGRIQVASAP